MASAELGNVENDARSLMCSIMSSDRRLDEMIRRASAIREKTNTMRDFQKSLDQVNAVTSNGPRRKALLVELKRENGLIMQYQKDNACLKKSVDECMETLDVIMTRHRVLMTKMNSLSKAPRVEDAMRMILNQDESKSNAEKEKLRGYVMELNGFISKEEDKSNISVQRCARLTKENKVLREMLQASEISNPGASRLFDQVMSILDKRGSVTSHFETDGLNETVLRRPNKATTLDTSGASVGDDLNNTVIERPNKSIALNASVVSIGDDLNNAVIEEPHADDEL